MALFVISNSVLLLIALALNLGLALYIYFKNPKDEPSRVFSYFLISSALWTLSVLLFLNAKTADWAIFFRRMTPVGSGMIAGLILYFSFIFPKQERKLSNTIKMVCLLPGLIFSLFSLFTPLMISQLLIKDYNYPFLGGPIFGPLYRIYSVYFIVYFVLGLGNLFYKYLKSVGIEKLQIFYILFGIVSSGFFGSIASLILPLMGFSSFFTIGPPFTLIMAFFITYAIIHYKLLNIENFLIRGVLFLFIILAVTGTIVSFILGWGKFLFSFYLVLANLALGSMVLLNNVKNKINLSFFGVICGVILWTIGVYIFFWHNTDLDILFTSGKIAFLGASFIPAFLLFFSLVFPKEINPISKVQWGLIVFPIIFFPICVFSNLILKEVSFGANGIMRTYGFMYPLFLLYYLIYFGLFFHVLFTKARKFSGVNQIQIRYVALAFGFSALIAITTNLILPSMRITYLTFLGPNSTIILIGIITYAILRHRLMSLEIIIQKSFIYGIAMAAIMAIYVIAIMFSEQFLRGILGYNSNLAIGSVVIIISFIAMPFVKSLQDITDKIFFKTKYDYQKTLRDMSRKIATQIRVEDLTDLIVSTFIKTMKVSEVSFLLLEKERGKYRSVPFNGDAEENKYKYIEMDANGPIPNWLLMRNDILFIDEIEDEISKQKGFQSKDEEIFLKKTRDDMARLGGIIWIPVISKNELTAIIFLGQKASGETFTLEDMVLLITLANQVAVALENTKLYEEVLTVKNYIQDIVDAMISGVLTIDVYGEIKIFNPMAEKITGLSHNDVIGKNFKELFLNNEISKILEATLKNRCFNSFESKLMVSDHFVPVSLSSTILVNTQGKKIGALLSITDLSEIKVLEEKARRVDKISALGTMAAGMAHEIKNPLSSLNVFSQLLPQRRNEKEFIDKLIETMPKEIKRINSIVETLMGFVKSNSPSFTHLNIKEVVEDNVKYFTEKAKLSSIEINTQYQTNLPLITADKEQLSQVFSNLILNAIQSIHNKGEINIDIREGRKIEGVLQDIIIEIKDTGHGISPENLKKIFDPFFTTKHLGTGLGLAITHSIIDGHKGSINIDSELGKGTWVKIILPVKQES